MATNRILIIVTNVGEYEKNGFRTGLWLGELTHFWDVAEKAGFELDIASPTGDYVPIDPESLLPGVIVMGQASRYYKDRAFMNRLRGTLKVSEVDMNRYDAIYLTGGHGTCFDFPASRDLADLIARFYESGKIVSAVCHGPAGLLNVTLSDGRSLIAGKNLTGYSWTEEVLAMRSGVIPFVLENELKKREAHFTKAKLPMFKYVVEDGRLITGQNPTSAGAVAEAVVRQLRGGQQL